MKYCIDMPFTFPGGITRYFDLIIPDGNPRDIPLLIWIHGGAWIGGEKRVHQEFERFLYRGFAVLSIDYRFAQEAPFPAQIIDCKTAVRWARAIAENFGYNADRIIVGGNSAGGHLAALMGVTNGVAEYDQGEHLDFSSDVQAVVDMFGPVNLVPEELPSLAEVLSTFLQDDPQKIRDASPIQRITGAEPPFLIMQGEKDPTVPLDQSVRFYEALRSAGVEAELCTVPGAGHGFDTLEAYTTLTDFILRQAPSAR